MSAADDEFWELYGDWGKDSDGNPLPLTVETYLGPQQIGGRFAPPVDKPGLPRIPVNRFTIDSDGNRAVVTADIFMPRDDLGLFTIGSRVTIDGQSAIVLTASKPDVLGILGFGVAHCG